VLFLRLYRATDCDGCRYATDRRSDPKDSAEIDRIVREGFVPLIRKGKGFIRYYWLDTGTGEGASFGLFRDKAGADESVHLAADFVREHLSKLLTSKPEIIEGPVVAHD
jgi:hypothetical protein